MSDHTSDTEGSSGSSQFPHSTVSDYSVPSAYSVIKCAILCSWNHTVGPQVTLKWAPEEGMQGPSESKDLQQLVARILHPDGLPWEEDYYNPKCKILVQDRKQTVAHARVLKDNANDCPTALIVIYSTDQLNMVWSLSNTVEVFLADTVLALSQSNKTEQDFAVISRNMTKLNDLLSILSMDDVQITRFPAYSSHAHESSKTHSKVATKEAIFLAKCLTSHLQTGCSLILTEGTSVPKISDPKEALKRRNPFVPGSLPYRVFWLLGNFLKHNEHYHSALSALNALNESTIFYPGLSLQTLSMDSKGYMKLDELLKSPCAPSVIDISRHKVRQLTRFAGEHSQSRENLKKELFVMENGCGGRSRLKTVLGSDSSAFINEFFDEFICDIDDETSAGATPDAINIFSRHLRLRGALAAKILGQHERVRPVEDRDKLLEPSTAHQWLFGVGNVGLTSSNLKSSRDSDLRIVLAQAEIFHSGISDIVGPFNF